MMPGWEGSPGACLERMAAETVGIPAYDALTEDRLDDGWDLVWAPEVIHVPGEGAKPMNNTGETVLEEARCVDQRMENYGPPAENFERIAALWTGFLKERFMYDGRITEDDVALMMILMKVGRLLKGYHRDSTVDIAGYARCLEMLEDARIHGD